MVERGARRRIIRFVAGASLLAVGPAAANPGVLCGSIGAPPGAIFLYPDESVSVAVSGNNFLIDGNDENLNGTPGAAAAIAGIATRNDANTQTAVGALNDQQRDNVLGLGFAAGPPTVPSILTVPRSPSAEDVSAFVAALLTEPHNQFTTTQIDNGNNAQFGGCALGCQGDPKISHFTAEELVVRGNGNIEGYGVLILDGSLVIEGTFDFYGLIILGGPLVLREDSVLGILGNMTVYGSIWTTGIDLIVGGSMLAGYSSQALGFAEQVAGPACELPSCGDGTVTYDEECDDGNVDDGDCCSAACTFEPGGSSCDGDLCTDDGCVEGVCVASPVDCGACRACAAGQGCVPAPASACRRPVPPHAARLALRDDPLGTGDKLTWSWRLGESTTLADFGDPTTSDDYALCLFGGESGSDLLLAAAAPAGGTCGDRPCWLPRTNRGFSYRNPLAPDGLAQVRLKAGPEGRGKIRVVGKGTALGLPSLPLALPVTMQLQGAHGACWEAEYSEADVTQNERRLRGQRTAP